MSRAMARAMSIVNLSFPEMVATAALFFPELVTRFGEFLDLGVAWPALNDWFPAIVQLMSKPARRLIGGDGSAGVCSISLDVEWLSAPSIFNRKVERAVQLALSKGGKGTKVTGRKRLSDRDDEEVATIFKKKKKGGKGKGAGKPRPKLKPKGKKAEESSEDDEDKAEDDDDDGGRRRQLMSSPRAVRRMRMANGPPCLITRALWSRPLRSSMLTSPSPSARAGIRSTWWADARSRAANSFTRAPVLGALCPCERGWAPRGSRVRVHMTCRHASFMMRPTPMN